MKNFWLLLKYINIISILLLLVWISLFPAPILQKYYFALEIFLLFSFVILLVRKGRSVFKLSDLPLWFFLLAISINVSFAQQKAVALKMYMEWAVPMFFIYYLVSESFSSQSAFNLLVKTISVLSILVALGGILEAIFAFNPIYEYFVENLYYHRYITGFVRPISTQFNPVVLGSYLLGSLPFNFLLFKQSRSFFRLLGAIGIILNIVIIILAFSRGVFLGLIAMVIFYLFVGGRRKSLATFFTILIIFVILFSYLHYPFSRFGISLATTQGDNIFSAYRLDRCIMTKRIINDHPFVGLGLQHSRIRFDEYYPLNNYVHYEYKIMDNMYLTILADTGLIGFSGFLIFILLLFKKGWRQLKILKDEQKKRWQLLLTLSAFIGLLVNMGAYELFYFPNIYLYFCILVGSIGAFSGDR
jgi:O-antigen ligase